MNKYKELLECAIELREQCPGLRLRSDTDPKISHWIIVEEGFMKAFSDLEDVLSNIEDKE